MGDMDHLYVENPATVERIKAAVPELEAFHPYLIESLWCEYSQLCYCAGYLDVHGNDLEDFRNFLRGTRVGAIYGNGA